jgi:uncharacterized protein YecT (DUF1311 family)
VRCSLVVAAIAVACLSASARAEDARVISCEGSTYEMVQCLKAKTARWDKRLNAAYRKTLKDAANAAQANELRAAQRAWIKYRDANCRFYDAGDGTIARIEAGECMRSMTEARAKELEALGAR